MNKPGPAAGSRRVVKQIVLTYTLEDDPDQKEHTLTLSSREGATPVDGLVWNAKLMERLAYADAQDPNRCERVRKRPARPEDGWTRRGSGDKAGSEATTSTAFSAASPVDGDCLWLHEHSCNWISWCDPWN